jgi:hypothetical protein
MVFGGYNMLCVIMQGVRCNIRRLLGNNKRIDSIEFFIYR